MNMPVRPKEHVPAFVIALGAVWVITLVGVWAAYAAERRQEVSIYSCGGTGDGPMLCGGDLFASQLATFPLVLAVPLGIAVILFSPLGCLLGFALDRCRSVLLHLAAFAVLGFAIGGVWWVLFGAWFTPGGSGLAVVAAIAVPAGWAVAQGITTHREGRVR
ncbi:hypothetical protein [Microbacterium sp. NPDC057650]|uniref:hypothetical protein n=1 Tax=unclassified Microbacterium TaxID=2609290 RepID=UPI00366CA548